MNAHAGNAHQRGGGGAQQAVLVRGSLVEAQLLEEVHGRRKADRAADVRRAGLELVWQLVPGG